MIVLNCEQQTDEWRQARIGIPTASEFDKILTSRGEPSKSAQKYMYKLAGERITGVSEEGFKSAHMLRGNEVEDEARKFYELIYEVEVVRVGLCYYNEDKKFACSPDGLIGNDGGIQIKCPTMAIHIDYLLGGTLPVEYFQQVQGELMITGRKWWDFLSYFPGLKPFVIRVTPDKVFIPKLKTALDFFCAELDAVVKKISE